MSIIDRIRGNPFKNLKIDELTAEKIRLERDEKLKNAEVKKHSKTKKELFGEGFGATEGEKRSLARQMKTLDHKIKLDNIILKRTSDEIKVVDNLIFIHENKQMLERDGLMKKLLKIPQSALDEVLAEIDIKDKMTGGKIDKILDTMISNYDLMDEIKNDKDTEELMKYWDTIPENTDVVFERYEREHSKETDEEFG